MRDIFAEIEQKERAIFWIAILLASYNTLRLLSIIAAPYPMDQLVHGDIGNSLAEYQAVWQNYLAIESETLQMSADSLKRIIFYNGCIAAGYIIFSLFLGKRKKFAKYLVTGLVLLEILMDIVVGIKYGILPSKISIIMIIFLLLFLFSPHSAKEFK